jgi:Xaa-Pro dipeptidase
MHTTPPVAELEERLSRLRVLLQQTGADAAVIERPEHVYYLTGVEPHRDYPALVVVEANDVHAFWPDAVPPGLPTWIRSDVYVLWPVTDQDRRRSLAAVEERIPTGAISDRDRAATPIFHELVRPKSAEQIATIERNLQGNDAAFAAIAGRFAPGVTDLDVYRWTVDALAREAGEAVVWDGNIGLGAAGGVPEATVQGAVAARGDVMFVDLYPRRQHHAGDSARCFVAGEVPTVVERAHALLEQALERVTDLLRPGAIAADLDAACRAPLDGNDLGATFPHHSGHAMGLFSQEPPYLIPGHPGILRPGDVIAVEPGLYMRGGPGLRLEDVFEITADGARSMTTFPRHLTVSG